MRRPRLLLFDIDGTLVNTGGAGVKSLKNTVRQQFKVDDDLRDIEIAGKTDIAIFRDILRKYGVAQTDERIAWFAAEYIAGLPNQLRQSAGRVLPGITELLTRLKPERHIVLGLLTGNLKAGAKLKLEHFGLWQFFEFGAFADDHHDRNELGAFARQRTQQKHGHDFEGADVDVIGDTGYDIACGRAFGARTIAVGTGAWGQGKLEAERPDFFFHDLSNVDAVVATLGW